MKTILTCCILMLFTLTSTPQSFAATSDAIAPAAASSVSSAPPAPAVPDASNAHAVAIYMGGSLFSGATLNQAIGVAVSGTSLSLYTACKDKGTVNNGDGTQQAATKCSQDSFKSVSNWSQPYTVPTSAIKTITWEQYKHHRIMTGLIVALFIWPVGLPIMCTTLEKDSISVTWDNHGVGGTLKFQADKKQYRAVLDALSKASGVTVTSAAQ